MSGTKHSKCAGTGGKLCMNQPQKKNRVDVIAPGSKKVRVRFFCKECFTAIREMAAK